jgi:septum formation protein
MNIILASQSPRRREYLAQLVGADGFQAVASDIPEPFDLTLSPAENAELLSRAKALHIQRDFPNDIIIASDTIVTEGDRMLAKPADRDEAESMLRSLFGHSTGVVTGLAVLSPQGEFVTHDITEVIFKSEGTDGLEEALMIYLDSGDWKDKAGAYGIQSGAAPLIQGIKGEYSTIVGLPVAKLRAVLREEFGITTNEVVEELPDGLEKL